MPRAPWLDLAFLLDAAGIALFATPGPKKGKIEGILSIEQPEQFWEASPFLIIVRT